MTGSLIWLVTSLSLTTEDAPMHPTDCPEFEYSNDPRKQQILKTRQTEVLVAAREDRAARLLSDTRPAHEHLFRDLCSPGYEYFAGHYRGETFRCLEFYEVTIKDDPRVGCQCPRVAGEMASFSKEVRGGIAAIEQAGTLPLGSLTKADRLIHAVALACRLFVRFLTIHPYANGNGHIARFVLIGVLMRQGYSLKEFPIDPRPGPPYIELIRRYRDGQVEFLERYILQKIE